MRTGSSSCCFSFSRSFSDLSWPDRSPEMDKNELSRLFPRQGRGNSVLSRLVINEREFPGPHPGIYETPAGSARGELWASGAWWSS